MNTTPFRIAGAVLLFAAIFASGYWLSRSGKPYSGILFNTHKLIALTAVVFLAIMFYQAHRMTTLSTTDLAAGVVTGLIFAGLFTTGSLLSIAKPMPAIVLGVHQVIPYLAVLSTALSLFLLQSRQ